MNSLREQFEYNIKLLNEDAGRGRGPQLGKGIESGFKAGVSSMNFDYLNKSHGNLTGKEANYNFNNYYTLDIRIKSDKLVKKWDAGESEYKGIFEKLYNKGNYEDKMIQRLRKEYEGFYSAEEAKAADKSKPIDDNIVALHKMDAYWTSLDMALDVPIINNRYKALPVISIFTDRDGKEALAIKQTRTDSTGFVELVMAGLTSAAVGHVPQGVTIEEILDGKFSRKAIAPEQGTFINRVKDPTSDKEFDFRSWDTKILVELHDLIMDTFKRNNILKMSGRSKLFLYMKQDDFNKFEKGGKGFSNLAKAAISNYAKVAEIVPT